MPDPRFRSPPLGRVDVRRRTLLKGAGGLALLCLPACAPATPAPRAAKIGRDVCDYCQMRIDDPRFVAEFWNHATHRVRIFDDPGCAILAAGEAGVLDDPKTPFWVIDARDGKSWIDARAASWRGGVPTPMNYNHIATTPGIYPLTFSAAVTGVRAAAGCLHSGEKS